MNPEYVADSIFARVLSDEVCEYEVRQFSNNQLPTFFSRKNITLLFSVANFAQRATKRCAETHLGKYFTGNLFFKKEIE
jgi:hypothetical protein